MTRGAPEPAGRDMVSHESIFWTSDRETRLGAALTGPLRLPTPGKAEPSQLGSSMAPAAEVTSAASLFWPLLFMASNIDFFLSFAEPDHQISFKTLFLQSK